jgi:hypothetical protein
MISSPTRHHRFDQVVALASIVILAANCSAVDAGARSDAAGRQPNAYAHCPIDRVILTQSETPGVRAGFARQKVRSNYASDLVFFVQRGNDRFWFGFSSPNGYGGTYIHPQIDPSQVKQPNTDEGPDDRLPTMIVADAEQSHEIRYEQLRMDFDAFGPDLAIYPGPPQSTDPAPAFIFARELGPHFYYAGNRGLYNLTEPVGVNIDLWRATGCDKVPH